MILTPSHTYILPFFLLLIQFIVRCQWVITNHFLGNLFLILRLLCSCSQRNMHIMNTYFEDFHKLKELIIIWIEKENRVSCPAAPLSSLLRLVCQPLRPPLHWEPFPTQAEVTWGSHVTHSVLLCVTNSTLWKAFSCRQASYSIAIPVNM